MVYVDQTHERRMKSIEAVSAELLISTYIAETLYSSQTPQ